MTTNHRMEGLSRAYLQAVAAQAGVNVWFQLCDYGVDVCLREIVSGPNGYTDTGIAIDVQLRSTTRAILREEEIAYDLEVRTYNLLRESPSNRPCVLVLFVMPDNEAEWLTQSETSMSLRNCCYWLSLHGKPASESHSTIRVAIPRNHQFDVAGLRQMFEFCRRGEL